jgi:uncharacterized protein (DUF362 family)
MFQFLQRVKKRILRPRILSKLVSTGFSPPRQPASSWQGISRVYRINSATDVPYALHKLSPLLDGEWREILRPEHSVLIKINLNTDDPYPASTGLESLTALVDLLWARGLRRIYVGDCSSNSALPTRRIAQRLGIPGAIAGKAELVYFDEAPWVTVPLPGTFLQEVTVPQLAMNVDRIIFLANMKTHLWADFTFGLKLAVGFMHPLERIQMHRERLQEKAVEINLAVPADLIIIDGRITFISGGPSSGRTEQKGLFLIGTNPLAVDLEAYHQLYNLKKEHNLLEHFQEDPFAMKQLSHARQCGLGGDPWLGYECVNLD